MRKTKQNVKIRAKKVQERPIQKHQNDPLLKNLKYNELLSLLLRKTKRLNICLSRLKKHNLKRNSKGSVTTNSAKVVLTLKVNKTIFQLPRQLF